MNSLKRSTLQTGLVYSKFAELRLKECILAGASGTHAVCVCTIHKNMKLMFQGAKLEELVDRYSYRDCFAETLCNPLRIQCFLAECTECPGVEPFEDKIEHHFDEQMINH